MQKADGSGLKPPLAGAAKKPDAAPSEPPRIAVTVASSVGNGPFVLQGLQGGHTFERLARLLAAHVPAGAPRDLRIAYRGSLCDPQATLRQAGVADDDRLELVSGRGFRPEPRPQPPPGSRRRNPAASPRTLPPPQYAQQGLPRAQQTNTGGDAHGQEETAGVEQAGSSPAAGAPRVGERGRGYPQQQGLRTKNNTGGAAHDQEEAAGVEPAGSGPAAGVAGVPAFVASRVAHAVLLPHCVLPAASEPGLDDGSAASPPDVSKAASSQPPASRGRQATPPFVSESPEVRRDAADVFAQDTERRRHAPTPWRQVGSDGLVSLSENATARGAWSLAGEVAGAAADVREQRQALEASLRDLAYLADAEAAAKPAWGAQTHHARRSASAAAPVSPLETARPNASRPTRPRRQLQPESTPAAEYHFDGRSPASGHSPLSYRKPGKASPLPPDEASPSYPSAPYTTPPARFLPWEHDAAASVPYAVVSSPPVQPDYYDDSRIVEGQHSEAYTPAHRGTYSGGYVPAQAEGLCGGGAAQPVASVGRALDFGPGEAGTVRVTCACGAAAAAAAAEGGVDVSEVERERAAAHGEKMALVRKLCDHELAVARDRVRDKWWDTFFASPAGRQLLAGADDPARWHASPPAHLRRRHGTRPAPPLPRHHAHSREVALPPDTSPVSSRIRAVAARMGSTDSHAIQLRMQRARQQEIHKRRSTRSHQSLAA
ncbi:hypothetical protein DIPPA_17935 [Diplonema papillatum]|nr:hypothetical protein DIPPA_17935 [Diplonema papillatum]